MLNCRFLLFAPSTRRGAREDERAPNAYIQAPNGGAALAPRSRRAGAAVAPRSRRTTLNAYGASIPRPLVRHNGNPTPAGLSGKNIVFIASPRSLKGFFFLFLFLVFLLRSQLLSF